MLDSFGIGKAPDAKSFGDEGADTLASLSLCKELQIPNMTKMGLGNIDGVVAVSPSLSPTASFAALCEESCAKDTTVGHWELMGVVSEKPFPTYPNGFPDSLIERFSEAVGRGILCNKPYSGTDVICDYGDEHVKTGKLIVYTSADSVFQIAAHEDAVSTDELYEICRTARKILVGEHAVGRVIARPFKGNPGNYVRTDARRDFSVEPSEKTVLDKLKSLGYDVIGVGKISDIFAGRGLTESIKTHSNRDGMRVTGELLKRDFSGLCFVNLVEFDSTYGHRRDARGYAAAISEFDLWLGDFLKNLCEEDVLIITADHGCDPRAHGTDHTRERVPMLLYSKSLKPTNYGTKIGFSFVGDTVISLLNG